MNTPPKPVTGTAYELTSGRRSLATPSPLVNRRVRIVPCESTSCIGGDASAASP